MNEIIGLCIIAICVIGALVIEKILDMRIGHCKTCRFRKCTSNHSPCIDCVDDSQYESDDDVRV